MSQGISTVSGEEGPLRSPHGEPLDLTAFGLDTGRIRLRPISMDDAEAIFREFTPAITLYMGPKSPDQIEQTQAWVASALRRLRDGVDLQLVVEDAVSGEFLGCCGLHGNGKPIYPEFGIWIKASAHGHGYGREAIAALKQWVDRNIQYEYLVYPVDRRNTASRRISESLGGVVFRENTFKKEDGNCLDLVVYKILPAVEDRA